MQPTDETKALELIAEACGSDDVLSERDVHLFDAGFLDSLAFVELLVAFEDQLGVVIAPTEIERQDVATVNKILAVLHERLQ